MSLADIDECELGIHNCHENSTCADVIGSFVCTCNNGFDGDGVDCTSKKEGMLPLYVTSLYGLNM